MNQDTPRLYISARYEGRKFKSTQNKNLFLTLQAFSQFINSLSVEQMMSLSASPSLPSVSGFSQPVNNNPPSEDKEQGRLYLFNHLVTEGNGFYYLDNEKSNIKTRSTLARKNALTMANDLLVKLNGKVLAYNAQPANENPLNANRDVFLVKDVSFVCIWPIYPLKAKAAVKKKLDKELFSTLEKFSEYLKREERLQQQSSGGSGGGSSVAPPATATAAAAAATQIDTSASVPASAANDHSANSVPSIGTLPTGAADALTDTYPPAADMLHGLTSRPFPPMPTLSRRDSLTGDLGSCGLFPSSPRVACLTPSAALGSSPSMLSSASAFGSASARLFAGRPNGPTSAAAASAFVLDFLNPDIDP